MLGISQSSIYHKGHIMATRTAPAVAIANITSSLTTLHVIDASGDLYTESIITPDLVSDTTVETWVAAYQAITQASVYKVTQQIIYEGDADPSNADVGQRNSTSDGINLLSKNATSLESQTPRVVAPVDAVMQGNQDIPLLSGGGMPAYITAYLAILTGYALVSAQFTGRRERKNNPRIRV